MGGMLSDEEIEALLAKAKEEAGGAAAPREPPAAQRFGPGIPEGIGAANERFALSLARMLGEWTGTRVAVRAEAAERAAFRDFILSIPDPATIFLAESAGGAIALELDPALSYAIVDSLLGGGDEPAFPARPHTPLESALLALLAPEAASLLEEAWEDLLPLRLGPPRQVDRERARAAAGEFEPSLLSTFVVAIGETEGLANVCAPCFSLSPLSEGRAEGAGAATPAASADISRAIALLRAESRARSVGPRGRDGTEELYADLAARPPEALARFLAGELPQAAALVLSRLGASAACAVLSALPYPEKGEAAVRLARMGAVGPEALRVAAEAALAGSGGSAAGSHGARRVGLRGIARLAAIVELADRPTEKRVAEALEEADPELAAELGKRVFIFEDFAALDDRVARLVLREAGARDLSLAMRTAGAQLVAKIRRNMTEDAFRILRDDSDFPGAVLLRDVEEAQARIAAIARRILRGEGGSRGRTGGAPRRGEGR